MAEFKTPHTLSSFPKAGVFSYLPWSLSAVSIRVLKSECRFPMGNKEFAMSVIQSEPSLPSRMSLAYAGQLLNLPSLCQLKETLAFCPNSTTIILFVLLFPIQNIKHPLSIPFFLFAIQTLT